MQAVSKPDGANGGTGLQLLPVLPLAECLDRNAEGGGKLAMVTVDCAQVGQHPQDFRGSRRMFDVHALFGDGFDAYQDLRIAK